MSTETKRARGETADIAFGIALGITWLVLALLKMIGAAPNDDAEARG